MYFMPTLICRFSPTCAVLTCLKWEGSYGGRPPSSLVCTVQYLLYSTVCACKCTCPVHTCLYIRYCTVHVCTSPRLLCFALLCFALLCVACALHACKQLVRPHRIVLSLIRTVLRTVHTVCTLYKGEWAGRWGWTKCNPVQLALM